MTTELTKAAQQALEVLKTYRDAYNQAWVHGMDILEPDGDKAVDELESALTQRPAAQAGEVDERAAFEAQATLESIINQYRIKAADAHWLRASLPAPQQATPSRSDCPGCDGRPSITNSPCAVCGGTQPATPPQQAAGEPVGEVVRDTLGRNGRPWLGVTWAPGIDLPEGTKIYTHPAPGVPEIDYTALIHAAWGKHKYAQGTGGCIAFKHGAEWFRDIVLTAAQAKGGEHA